jgi:hypothetical protein
MFRLATSVPAITNRSQLLCELLTVMQTNHRDDEHYTIFWDHA